MSSLEQRAEGEVVTAEMARDAVARTCGVTEAASARKMLLRYIDQSEHSRPSRSGVHVGLLRDVANRLGASPHDQDAEDATTLHGIADELAEHSQQGDLVAVCPDCREERQTGDEDGCCSCGAGLVVCWPDGATNLLTYLEEEYPRESQQGDPSDTARLDWLEVALMRGQSEAVFRIRSHDISTVTDIELADRCELGSIGYEPTLRAAIDAAMSKQGGEDGVARESGVVRGGSSGGRDVGGDSRHPGAESEAEAVTPDTVGARLIAEERRRQVEKEGWTPEHDAQHADGSLVLAAICYAASATEEDVRMRDGNEFVDPWPWDREWDKRDKHDRRRKLVIAGALLAAELDRTEADHDLPDEGASEREGERAARELKAICWEIITATHAMDGADRDYARSDGDTAKVNAAEAAFDAAEKRREKAIAAILTRFTRLQEENERLAHDLAQWKKGTDSMKESWTLQNERIKVLADENADLRSERERILELVEGEGTPLERIRRLSDALDREWEKSDDLKDALREAERERAELRKRLAE